MEVAVSVSNSDFKAITSLTAVSAATDPFSNVCKPATSKAATVVESITAGELARAIGPVPEK